MDEFNKNQYNNNQANQWSNPSEQRSIVNTYVSQEIKETNSIGTAGFVLSIIALLLSWIPFVVQILWFLGVVFSIIGLTKQPKGLAIAGTIISFIGLILIIIIFAFGLLAAIFS